MDNNHLKSTEPFNIHAPHPFSCSLGSIIYAGTKWNSRATYGHAPPPDFMRTTPHHLLVYTLEGEADYVDDTGIKTVLRKGMLIWSRPGINQSYGPRPGSCWSEFYMWFGGPIFDIWQNHGFPGEKSVILLIEPIEYWIGRFRKIVQPDASALSETSLVRVCRLQELLAEALQIQDNSRQSKEDLAWKVEACRKLTEGSLNSPPLPMVAKSMGMSYVLFRKKFLGLTGKSPGKFRSEETIRKTCMSLLGTKESIAEISDKFGYHDQFHFSRRFKEAIGVSPKEFRKRSRDSGIGACTRPGK